MKRLLVAAAACTLTGGLVACGGGTTGGQGTLHSAGVVHLHHGASQIIVSAGQSRRLVAGDELNVSSGLADISLPGGGSLELRPGSDVRFPSGPQLQSGDLLVESAHSQPVRVGSAMGIISVTGASRLRRDLAVEVGAYSGVTTVAAARTVTIPGLEEDTVPAVGVVPDPSPIQLHASDPWDERFLGTAIDLTSQLDSQSSYVTANSPVGVPHTAAFYRRAIPALAGTPVFTDALLASATPGTPGGVPPPGDALVAAAIALSGRGSFVDRWRSVFTLRQEGGQWGVVVLSEQADPATVLRLVGGALDQAVLTPVALTVTQVSPTPAPATIGPPSTNPGPVVTTGTGQTTSTPAPTTTTRAPGKHPTTTTTRPPLSVPTITLPPAVQPSQPSSPPPTTPPVLAPLVNPIVNIIQALTGGGSSG